jgi:hypothetical protein
LFPGVKLFLKKRLQPGDQVLDSLRGRAFNPVPIHLVDGLGGVILNHKGFPCVPKNPFDNIPFHRHLLDNPSLLVILHKQTVKLVGTGGLTHVSGHPVVKPHPEKMIVQGGFVGYGSIPGKEKVNPTGTYPALVRIIVIHVNHLPGTIHNPGGSVRRLDTLRLQTGGPGGKVDNITYETSFTAMLGHHDISIGGRAKHIMSRVTIHKQGNESGISGRGLGFLVGGDHFKIGFLKGKFKFGLRPRGR